MRGIALAVLLNLANRQALSLELVGSVQVAVDSAQQRLREGKATPAGPEGLHPDRGHERGERALLH